MDPDIARRTHEAFDGKIKKPKFTQKLLSKPPFRYLHDIVSAVAAKTGFGQGLYSGEEMDGRSIKGKGPKIAYLTKILHCVQIARGVRIDINLAKVVAGKEPEKTNVFLQMLASVAWDDRIDREECVRRALAGEETSTEPPTVNAEKSPNVVTSNESKISAGESVVHKAATNAESKRPQSPVNPGASSTEELSAKGVGDRGSPGRQELTQRLDRVTDDIEETRALVSSIIDRPKCSDKLLARPPFRFLHDVVIGISKATSYRIGLYEGDELNGKSFKGKASKISFLQKILTAVVEDSGREVDINLSKVVAGKECDKTRRFIQIVAIVASSASETNTDDRESKMSGKSAPRTRERERKNASDDDAKAKRASRRRETDDVSRGASEAAELREAEKIAAERRAAESAKRESVRQSNDTKHAEESPRPSASNDEQKIEFAPAVVERPKTKRLQRPSTARRRPPTIRQKVKVVESKREELDEDHKAKGVMLEGEDDDDDDDDDENEGPSKRSVVDDIDASRTEESKLNKDEHGRLVRDILTSAERSKKAKKSSKSGRVEADDGDGSIRMGRIGLGGDGGVLKIDLKTLREQVQRLCRSTNPLGSSIDNVQDDLDMMKKELEKWKAEFGKYATRAEKEMQKTEEALQPLHGELSRLDEQTNDLKRLIDVKRAVIARNDRRIEELLRMVVATGKTNKGTAGRSHRFDALSSMSESKQTWEEDSKSAGADDRGDYK